MISPSSAHGDWQISQNFYTDMGDQGKYKLVLITNGEETHTFEFIVRQVGGTIISNIQEKEGSPSDIYLVDTSALKIIDMKKTEVPNRWVVNLEYCVGPDSINVAPVIIFSSDYEIFEYVWQKINFNPGTCSQQFIEVMANESSSIVAYSPELNIYSSNDFHLENHDEILSKLQLENTMLKNELRELEEKVGQKDAILMEQLKVIKDLAMNFKETSMNLFSAFDIPFAHAEAPKITIIGKPELEIGKVHSIIIRVEGKPYNNGESHASFGLKGGYEDPFLIKIHEGDTRFPINLVDYGCEALECIYTPELISIWNPGDVYVIKVQNLNVVAEYEFTLIEKPPSEFESIVDDNFEIQQEIQRIKVENNELKQKILELEKKVKGKDAVLMEQIKVIQQLASSFQNTVFEKILQNLGFVV
jgi:hypothetical protein